MKRLGLFLLAVVIVAGLAGCGGGDDDDAKECVAEYCATMCDKFIDCGLLPASVRDECVSTCVEDEEGLSGGSEDECRDAFAVLSSMSCSDFIR